MKRFLVVLMMTACCFAQGKGSPRRKSTPTPTPHHVSVADVRKLLQPVDLKLIADPVANAEAMIDLATLQARFGDISEATKTLAAAEVAIAQLQDDSAKTRIGLETSRTYAALGQVDHAIELVRGKDNAPVYLQAIALIQAWQGDFAGALKTLGVIPTASARDAAIRAVIKVQLATRHFDEAESASESVLDPRVRIDVLREIHLAMFKGDYGEESVHVIKRMEALAEEAGADACYDYLQIGRAAVAIHDVAMAYTYFARAAETADKITDAKSRAMVRALIASSWGDTGDLRNRRAALALTNKAITDLPAIADSAAREEAEHAVVLALVHGGEYARALDRMDGSADLRIDMAEIEAGQGKTDEALALVKVIIDPLPRANALLRIAKAMGERDRLRAMQLLTEVSNLASQPPTNSADSTSGPHYRETALVEMAQLGDFQQALHDAVPGAGMDTFRAIGALAFSGGTVSGVLDMAASIREKSGDGADYMLLGATETALNMIPPEKLRSRAAKKPEKKTAKK